MSSWHELGARDGFEHVLKIRGAESVYRTVELGRQALWCTRLDCAHAAERGIVGQTYQGDEALEQLWCRGQLEHLLQTGTVRRRSIVIGQGPGADRRCEENEGLLRTALTAHAAVPTVVASTSGRTDDGEIAWLEPLGVLSAEEVRSGRPPEAVLPPDEAPLEVGYTFPSRTLLHLFEEGAIWRWPYNSERLWLLAAVAESDDGWTRRPLLLDVDFETLYSPS